MEIGNIEGIRRQLQSDTTLVQRQRPASQEPRRETVASSQAQREVEGPKEREAVAPEADTPPEQLEVVERETGQLLDRAV